jgi:hypothetical protein
MYFGKELGINMGYYFIKLDAMPISIKLYFNGENTITNAYQRISRIVLMFFKMTCQKLFRIV